MINLFLQSLTGQYFVYDYDLQLPVVLSARTCHILSIGAPDSDP